LSYRNLRPVSFRKSTKLSHKQGLKKSKNEWREGKDLFLSVAPAQTFQIIDYVASGIKPRGELDLPTDTPKELKQTFEDYIRDRGLSFYQDRWETDDPKEPFRIRYVIFSKDGEAKKLLERKLSEEELGKLLGYPEKAIKAYAKGETLAVKEFDEGLLEYIPVGMTKSEIKEEMEKRRRVLTPLTKSLMKAERPFE